MSAVKNWAGEAALTGEEALGEPPLHDVREVDRAELGLRVAGPSKSLEFFRSLLLFDVRVGDLDEESSGVLLQRSSHGPE